MLVYYWKFDLVALSNSALVKVETTTEEKMYSIINGLYTLFGNVNHESQKLEFGALQKTPDLCHSIKELINQQSEMSPTLNKLVDYFRNLNEDEYFYFIPEMDGSRLSNEMMRWANACLISLRDNKNVDDVHEELRDYWNIREVYSLETFGKYIEAIGEPNKKDRICRFCNKGIVDGVTFKTKAHAISEALGNKNLILCEECDQCNDKFGKTIEPDIINFFSLYRTMFKVKGKNGLKDFKGKLFHVTRTEKGLEVNIKGKPQTERGVMPYSLRFQADTPLVSQNIYKALCKYFLSVVKTSELNYFQKTVDWINGNQNVDFLPAIAELKYNNPLMTTPMLRTYIRKNDDLTLPYAVGELHFTAFMYVFIIPLCSNDTQEFIDGEEYMRFWNFFKIYHKMGDWAYRDFSAKTPKDFGISLKFMEK